MLIVLHASTVELFQHLRDVGGLSQHELRAMMMRFDIDLRDMNPGGNTLNLIHGSGLLEQPIDVRHHQTVPTAHSVNDKALTFATCFRFFKFFIHNITVAAAAALLPESQAAAAVAGPTKTNPVREGLLKSCAKNKNPKLPRSRRGQGLKNS